MTELIELIKKRKEEFVQQIDGWADRMYEAQPESLKRQMAEAQEKARLRVEADWDKAGERMEDMVWRDPADITAWGDAERPEYTIDYLWEEADEANLEALFDESFLTGALIVWHGNMPAWSFCPPPIERLRRRMEKVWGELPPHIEISDISSDKKHGGGYYSIKPVWEL